jgi:F0F1-type ATP synthase assembly protein I
MFLGIWLDKRLGSSPWFVLICVFVGAGAGFYSIYRRLMGSAKRDSRTGAGGTDR